MSAAIGQNSTWTFYCTGCVSPLYRMCLSSLQDVSLSFTGCVSPLYRMCLSALQDVSLRFTAVLITTNVINVFMLLRLQLCTAKMNMFPDVTFELSYESSSNKSLNKQTNLLVLITVNSYMVLVELLY